MKTIIKSKYLLYTILLVLILLIQGTVYFDLSVEELKAKYAKENSKFIAIDGNEIHYRDEGSGQPIVLIHGIGASLHTWDDWASELKKNFRVIRMDLPGFGLTGEDIKRDYSLNNYTAFLDRFLSEINASDSYLVGNSLGGYIAWNFTAENPGKVKKLILIDSMGLSENQPDPWFLRIARTPILNSVFLYITPRKLIKSSLEQVYEDDSKVTEELVTRYHELVLKKGNRKAFIDRAKVDFKLGDKQSIDKLRSIATETLLIWGENDNWIPLDNGKRMKDLLENSELVVLENAGHVPMEESPMESLKILLSFIGAGK